MRSILNNITFGTIGSDPTFDITGIRIAGDFTVNAVPESATILLFGLGGLSLLRKRRYPYCYQGKVSGDLFLR